MPKFEKGNP
ncbi:unnamed protein product, partial [Allacma fusca]